MHDSQTLAFVVDPAHFITILSGLSAAAFALYLSKIYIYYIYIYIDHNSLRSIA